MKTLTKKKKFDEREIAEQNAEAYNIMKIFVIFGAAFTTIVLNSFFFPNYDRFAPVFSGLNMVLVTGLLGFTLAILFVKRIEVVRIPFIIFTFYTALNILLYGFIRATHLLLSDHYLAIYTLVPVMTFVLFFGLPLIGWEIAVRILRYFDYELDIPSREELYVLISGEKKNKKLFLDVSNRLGIKVLFMVVMSVTLFVLWVGAMLLIDLAMQVSIFTVPVEAYELRAPWFWFFVAIMSWCAWAMLGICANIFLFKNIKLRSIFINSSVAYIVLAFVMMTIGRVVVAYDLVKNQFVLDLVWTSTEFLWHFHILDSLPIDLFRIIMFLIGVMIGFLWFRWNKYSSVGNTLTNLFRNFGDKSVD